ncbi:hypothetical protein [Streptomyces sp. NRRL F-5650]|uniref:hypothetical protein n=1 Tax=Streptomyces sp. NRRL F-5650 TaxID=1463868 RepID=UPI000690C8D8
MRTDAARALAAAGHSRLPLYWSGRERRCGRPQGDRIDVVAAPGGGCRLTETVRDRPPRTVPLDATACLGTALAALPSSAV